VGELLGVCTLVPTYDILGMMYNFLPFPNCLILGYFQGDQDSSTISILILRQRLFFLLDLILGDFYVEIEIEKDNAGRHLVVEFVVLSTSGKASIIIVVLCNFSRLNSNNHTKSQLLEVDDDNVHCRYINSSSSLFLDSH
jgi:hypothetical protein